MVIFIPRFMTETQLAKPKEGKMRRTTIVLKLGLAIALALAFGARIASADQAVYDLFTGNGGGLGSFTGPYAVASPVGTRDVSKNDTTIGGTGKTFAYSSKPARWRPCWRRSIKAALGHRAARLIGARERTPVALPPRAG